MDDTFDDLSNQRMSRRTDGIGNSYLSANGGPTRGLAVSDAQDFSNYAHQAQGAQSAPFGSIAARFDPNAYGSIASRKFGGAFGPSGSFNPQYRQESMDYQNSIQQGMQRMQAQDPNGPMQTQAGAFGRAVAANLAPYLGGPPNVQPSSPLPTNY